MHLLESKINEITKTALDILIPFGSDYHGWQSHTYVPADVRPFR